jgi:hypothetical protein
LKECGSVSKIGLAAPRFGVVPSSSRCVAVVAEAFWTQTATGQRPR